MKKEICLIEKFALHDGPGLRTVIFFKGCPLKCLWCSNPETQKLNKEIFYNSKNCVGCEKCKKICSRGAISITNKKVLIENEKCNLCGECIEVCPMGALKSVSKEMDVNEVFNEVIKDVMFYKNSGGGVTASGGEILLHSNFVINLFKKCKEEYINTAIETSGYGKSEDLKKLAKVTDYIMFDIKHTNNKEHVRLTGVSNELIIKNLKEVSEIHNNIIIRIPLIKEINDSEENIINTINIAKECNIKEIHLLPYHTLGLEKYKQLNKEYKMEEILKNCKEDLETIKDKIEINKIKCVIGG